MDVVYYPSRFFDTDASSKSAIRLLLCLNYAHCQADGTSDFIEVKSESRRDLIGFFSNSLFGFCRVLFALHEELEWQPKVQLSPRLVQRPALMSLQDVRAMKYLI